MSSLEVKFLQFLYSPSPVTVALPLALDDVESNRLAAKTAVAERLYRSPFGAVGDLLHRCQIAFQRLLNDLFGNQLSNSKAEPMSVIRREDLHLICFDYVCS